MKLSPLTTAINRICDQVMELDVAYINSDSIGYSNEEYQAHYRYKELRGYQAHQGIVTADVVDGKKIRYEYPDFLVEYTDDKAIYNDIPHLPRGDKFGLDTIMKLKRLDHKKDCDGKNIALYEPVRVGRYIKSLNPNIDDKTIESISNKLKNHRLNHQVKITGDTRKIRALYVISEKTNSNINSCMASRGKYHWHKSFTPPTHPTQVYGGDSGIKLAYIMEGKKVVARSLYSDKNKGYTRVYGANPHYHLLHEYFNEIGYREFDEALDGHVLNQVKTSDGYFVIPYIDGHNTVKENDNGTFTISEYGGYKATFYQTCTTRDFTNLTRCARCDDVINDDDDFDETIEAYNGDIFCDSGCANANDIYCDIDGDYHSRDDMVYIEWLSEYILIDNLSQHDIYEAVDCEYYPINELVEHNGDYYPKDDLSDHGLFKCSQCGDINSTQNTHQIAFENLLSSDFNSSDGVGICSFSCLESHFDNLNI
jgi:hypothetical protein